MQVQGPGDPSHVSNGFHEDELHEDELKVPPVDADLRPFASAAEDGEPSQHEPGTWRWAREQRRIRRRERLQRMRRVRARGRARAAARAELAGERARAAAARARARAAEYGASARDHLEELVRHAKTLLRVRGERQKLAVRRATRKIALGVLAGIVGLTLVISASLRVVSGIAGGFAEAFGNRAWAGNLAAGILILGGGVGAWLAMNASRDRKEFQRRLVEHETERRERAERARERQAAAQPGGAAGPGGGSGLAGNSP